MTKYECEVRRYLEQAHPDYVRASAPRWLSNARWKPALCFDTRRDQRVLAVDILPSGAIPRTLFRNEVKKLLDAHERLRAVVCVLEQGFEDHPELQSFCTELGIGLKVLMPGLGLDTVVRTDLDPELLVGQLAVEDGWFPRAILGQASTLTNLAFSAEIDRFVTQVNQLGDDETATLQLVHSTMNRLVSQHPTFRGNVPQFMRLTHFENLLKLSSASASEHVFHSFRVFLAGCPIINQFYDVFRAAHERFCVGPKGDLCVEYAWLLASIFHDVGRPKEGAEEFIREELQDDDLEVSVTGKETRWLRRDVSAARRTLASLGVHVADFPDSGNWEGGAVEDDKGESLGVAWTQLYDRMQSHAIIGALDFLSQVFRTAAAVDEMSNRAFVVTHAVPAALAILLHDWRIWTSAKSWRLFPVNALAMPMAALLIYLDTWDDYKRRGPDPLVYVRDYVVEPTGAKVIVEWGNSEALEKERMKYQAFKRALRNKPFPLKITVRMADTA